MNEPWSSATTIDAILMLDWATAGRWKPSTSSRLSVFLRMDEVTSLHLFSAYDGSRSVGLPGRFLTTAGWRRRSWAHCSCTAPTR